MGGVFGKSKSKAKTITERDKAVLKLKQQRDSVKQYRKRIESRLEEERLLAQKLIRDGKKERALTLLRKKKYLMNVLGKQDDLLETLEKLIDDLTFMEIEVKVVEVLKEGNEALKELNSILSVEKVESILEDTREGVEKQKEINDLLTAGLSEEDEGELMEELELLTQEVDQELDLPKVPQTELPTNEKATRRQQKEKVAA